MQSNSLLSTAGRAPGSSGTRCRRTNHPAPKFRAVRSFLRLQPELDQTADGLRAFPRSDEYLRAHRQRLIVDLNKLRSNSSWNVDLALGKMTEDLSIIDAGIARWIAQGDIGAIVRALPASPWS